MGFGILDFSELITPQSGLESIGVELNTIVSESTLHSAFDTLLASQLESFPESQKQESIHLSELSPGLEIDIVAEEGGNISPIPAEFFHETEENPSIQEVPLTVNLLSFDAKTKAGVEKPLTVDTPTAMTGEKALDPNGARFSLVSETPRYREGLDRPVIETVDSVDRLNISTEELNRTRIEPPTSRAAKPRVITVQNPVGQPGWNDEVGDRIVWMIRKSQPSAEIRLNPPQLGPLEVKIEMVKDQANVTFSSQNSQVRDALESAFPRLRELLGAQQVQLNDVFVSSHSFAGNSESNKGSQHSAQKGTDIVSGDSTENPELDEDLTATNTIITKGILSLYA